MAMAKEKAKKTARPGSKTHVHETAIWDEEKERREFQAGLRERLLEVLAFSNVPAHGSGSFLAKVTHRTKQATTRWLREGDAGGIPDAIALRQIALAFNIDPAHLMGLRSASRARDERRARLSGERHEWLAAVDDKLMRGGASMRSFTIESNDMEPTIVTGALVYFDSKANRLTTSGLYVVRAARKLTVRRVEKGRSEDGFFVRRDNARYRDAFFVANELELKKHGVHVLGRVRGWLNFHRR